MKFDVIILAGGLGTRLRHVISDLPKPMAPVNGRPFLSYVLDKIASSSIQNIILSIGYMGEKISNEYGAEYKGIPIRYVEEKEPLGTGGGIKKALYEVETEQVIILNGDTFFDIDLKELLAFHLEGDKDLSLALKPMQHPDRYGTVEVKNNRVQAFREKQANLANGLINAGVYAMNTALRTQFPKEDKFSFEQDVLEVFMDSWNIGGYISDGFFIDIGIPEDYERAQGIFS